MHNPGFHGRLPGQAAPRADIAFSVEESLRFLAEAGKVLAGSLELEATLERVVRLAVPVLSDWCTVHLREEDGSVRLASVAHADPEKVKLARDLAVRYPVSPEATHGIAAALRSGASELIPDIPDELLVRAARDQDHLAFLRSLRLRSYMIIPLKARGRVLGTITFLYADSGRRYCEADLVLAEELAQRVALALDNVALHAALKRSEAMHRILTDNVPQIVWMNDAQGNPIYFNRQWTLYTGKEFRPGQPVFDPMNMHPEDLPRVLEVRARGIAAGEPYEMEVRMRRHDGEYRWHLARIKPLRGPDGSIERWFGTATDVHELRAAREELDQALRGGA